MAKLLCLVIAVLLVTGRPGATTVTVTVGNGGGFNFTPSNFTINPGDTVRWEWASGHHNTSDVTIPAGTTGWYSNITSTVTNFTYVPQVSGLYTYTCTFHSGMDGRFFVTGCSFPAKPVITSANGNSACQGDTIMLNTTMQTGVTYQWINGLTAIPSATTNSLPVTASGQYKVLVNRCGVDSISVPFNVTVHPLPIPSFTYTFKDLEYTFTNTTNPTTGHSFSWTFDDGSPVDNTASPVHMFPTPGTYKVTLAATNIMTSCTDSFSAIIQAKVGVNMLDRDTYAIYPNPVSNIITVEVSEKAILTLSDAYGRILHVPVKGEAEKRFVDVSSLSAGMYVMYIITATGTAIEKIVILR